MCYFFFPFHFPSQKPSTPPPPLIPASEHPLQSLSALHICFFWSCLSLLCTGDAEEIKRCSSVSSFTLIFHEFSISRHTAYANTQHDPKNESENKTNIHIAINNIYFHSINNNKSQVQHITLVPTDSIHHHYLSSSHSLYIHCYNCEYSLAPHKKHSAYSRTTK